MLAAALLVTLGCVGQVWTSPFYNGASYESGVIQGYCTAPVLDEMSGLVASRRHDNVLYTLNDSDGPAQVFALDARDGSLLATFDISGATNCDWEDITVGAGSDGNMYIYIGDIGGNVPNPCFVIYRVKEPDSIRDQTLPVDSKLLFSWSNAENSETMFVDPWDGELYLISKVLPYRTPRLYNVPRHGWGSEERIQLDQGDPVNIDARTEAPVAGDISINGQDILLKTYNCMLYWRRRPFQSLADVLRQEPTCAPYEIEPQGEAVCFDSRGAGYYTVSEGLNQPLWYYKQQTFWRW